MKKSGGSATESSSLRMFEISKIIQISAELTFGGGKNFSHDS